MSRPIIDMHCDTISEIYRERQKQFFSEKHAGMTQAAGMPNAAGRAQTVGIVQNFLQVDLVRMKKSGYLLQNFALFINLSQAPDPWKSVRALYDVYQEEMKASADLIAPVLKYEEIERNRKAGKMSALLTVEEGGICCGEIEKLEKLYRMGVRMMTLTWNYPNELGMPALCRTRMQETEMQPKDGKNRKAEGQPEDAKNPEDEKEAEQKQEAKRGNGLTPMGFAFLERMEELGMIPDVSHLSDEGFYDVARVAKKPFAASHSNARTICPHPRNLTDDMIRILADKGGIMGLNYYPPFVAKQGSATKEADRRQALIRHAVHIVKVGGIEVLGLGGDFDGMDGDGCLKSVQEVPQLEEDFCKAGFTPRQIDRIFAENVLRFYRDLL